MSPNEPKTVRVTCPHCDTESAFATIPKPCQVAPVGRADGKVRSVCRDCDGEFVVHFERP